MVNMSRLSNKVAIVTGASKGIGGGIVAQAITGRARRKGSSWRLGGVADRLPTHAAGNLVPGRLVPSPQTEGTE
jgi:NAD(P)-dependent dehydrogenase (short-subunit alcohol dehydrogenase family)